MATRKLCVLRSDAGQGRVEPRNVFAKSGTTKMLGCRGEGWKEKTHRARVYCRR